ncbi:hypothetical protein M2140_000173 [Clostridiales Family XIII bacterium PM5-7]
MASKKKYKVGIFCGHGKSLDGSWDPGTTYNKESEAALMLPITKAAVKYLKASGITVVTDATSGNDINMVKQVEKANKEKVDIFVSIHCDWYIAPTGTMPLYLTTKGKAIAKAIDKRVKADMKMTTRGLTKRKDLYELTATNMPACIYETGSIKADLTKLKKSDAYGKAIAKGICDYLKVTFVDNSTPTTPAKPNNPPKTPFKIKAKGNLIVRKEPSLKSDKVSATCAKGGVYTIVEVNKDGTRGKLKSGAGWITITDKYVEVVK